MLKSFAEHIGINRIVMALSVARLGDAVGNSILFVIIPLYVAQLPAPWFPFPESVRVGILIALYGLVNAALQPVMGALSDRLGKRKPLILGGLLSWLALHLLVLPMLALRYGRFERATDDLAVTEPDPAGTVGSKG